MRAEPIRASGAFISRDVVRAFLSIAVVFIGLGCGSQPIPTSIVEGTSGTITIIPEVRVGYGRVMAGVTSAPAAFDANSIDEDIQRGETVLTLVDEQGADISRLPVRFITRAEIDSAAYQAYTAETTGTKSQVIVVFDVPPDLVKDADDITGDGLGYRHLTIRVELWRRNMSTTNKDFEQLTVFDAGGGTPPRLGVGWGSSDTYPTVGIPITVVDDPAPAASEPSTFSGFVDPEPTQIGPNKRTGWGADIDCSGGPCVAEFKEETDFDTLRAGYVPNPEYKISIGGSCTACVPGAWEFEVDYPSERVSIVNVVLDRKTKDQAYLDWDAPESTAACSSPTTQTLKVRISDRQALSRGVKIAFKLRNTADDGCQSPIVANDFIVTPTSAYDVNGDPKSFPVLTHQVL